MPVHITVTKPDGEKLTNWITLDDGRHVPTCLWIEDMQVDDVAWQTDCGNLFQFTADGPKENAFTFCPYCGGALIESRPETEGDSEHG